MGHVSVRSTKVIVESVSSVTKTSAADILKDSQFPNLMSMKDSEWVNWNAFASWLQQLDLSALSPIDWKEVGARSLNSKGLQLAISIIATTQSVRLAYWAAAKWFGPSQFKVITCRFEDLGPQVIHQTLEFSTALDPCVQIFKIFEGSLAVMPKYLFQLPESKVTAIIEGRKALYTITFPKTNSIRLRLMNFMRAPKQQKQIFTELGNVQSALSIETNKLIEERGEFKQLFSNFPDGIIIFRDGKIVFANDKIVSSLRYRDSQQIIGRNFLDFVCPSNHKL